MEYISFFDYGIRVSKGCAAFALYHILMCKLICNSNIWYERSTKGAFDTRITMVDKGDK